MMREQSRGLWTAPLSDDQICEAIAFGVHRYPDAASIDDDPYSLWVPHVNVLLSIGSAFGRISAYVGSLQGNTEALDGNVINEINTNEAFAAGYFIVRIISGHEIVSVVRYKDGEDGRVEESMNAIERGKSRTGQFVIACMFANPSPPWESIHFEVLVPEPKKWFSKQTYSTNATEFAFDGDLH